MRLRPTWLAAGGLGALVVLVLVLIAVHGSSATSSRPPAAGHEGISGRATTAVAGRGVHALHGTCITGYDLEVDGRSGDTAHLSLTLMLASAVTTPEELAAQLSTKACAAENAAARPAVDPGHLSVWYLSASGGRLSVP